MDIADQVMELHVFQYEGPGPHKLLMEYLRNRHFAAFKSLAVKGLKKNPPNIDIDRVYPYPLDKTVLDIACSNGLVEFVELILNLGANPNKENVVHQRSPLHFAAEAGHAAILNILLSQPTIKPNLEIARQTALHLAVMNKNVECVQVLLEHNANPNIANSKGLTPTHMAAITSQEVVINLIFQRSKCPADIDSFKDFTRRTTRQVLEQTFPHMSLPPVLDRKTDVGDLKYFLDCNDEESYLTYAEDVAMTPEQIADMIKLAAKHDLAKVIKFLIRLENEENRILLAEAADIAAERGHCKVLEELFDGGAERSGRLLIKACQELGSHAVRGSDRVACVRLILLKPVDVRWVDENGNTALHYAARAESSEIISLLLKAGSYIGHQNHLGIPPIANISPETMSRYLDDCLQTNKEYADDYEDYAIEFNYQCLVPHGLVTNQDREHLLEKGPINYNRISMEMQPLSYIANSNLHQHLLKHPILSSFLYLKWQRISPILYANFIFYVIFYFLLNAYILCMTWNSDDDPPSGETDLLNNKSSNGNINATNFSVASLQHYSTLWTFTTIALVILILREMLQLISSPWDYFPSPENWLELLLILLGISLLGGAGPKVGAVAILLSAWELVILIGQHPRMSTAIEMFKTVTLNFMHFLFLYAFLILAFAFAFYALFKDDEGSNFPDPGHALFKTIIMLTGEFDADEIPFRAQPILSHIVFILFVFLIAIVLFNLLNGLAVSDTADILGKAELVGLISRTKLIAYAESVVVGSPMIKSRLCYFSGKNLQRSQMNPLRFLSTKILFFPDFIPEAKVRVKPLRCNTVIPLGKTEPKNKCWKLKLDPDIVAQAKEIVSSRGRISDYEKIIHSFNQRFEKLEVLLNRINLAVRENNCNNNYDVLGN